MKTLILIMLLFLYVNIGYANDVVFKVEFRGAVDKYYGAYAVIIERWNSSLEDTPNPLYKCDGVGARCELLIFYKQENVPEFGYNYISLAEVDVYNKKTVADLSREVNRVGAVGKEHILIYPLSWNVRLCLFLGGSYIGGKRAYPIPGTTVQCTYPLLPPTVCNVAEASINLNHGTVMAQQVNGHTASSSFHVACTSPMRVRLQTADEQGSIFLNPEKTLRSDIFVNGVSIANNGVVIDAATGGGTEVSIKSVLSGAGFIQGKFSGNKVLILAIE
ncbi:hypothetical protein I5N37_05005 [Serratia marcescens]|uniref:MrpH family fimbial adhesin n=1 Tax=Serratia TaxID=613 RepID=UPI001317A9C3|nr:MULTISPECIES: hypothetical protein [Serratia]MBH3270713.1 hypothetical protein [Serratia marcescens]MDI3150633.1 hypothetical protein [Serratia nevei]QHC47751.1 hypothetical protein EFZ62_23520 [Serratia marcescens]